MKNRLSWKLTKSIVKIVISVMILSIIGLGIFLYLDAKYAISDKIVSPFKEVDYTDPYELTRTYEKYIRVEDGNFYLTKMGMKILDEKEAWFQLLDETGLEVFSVNTNEDVLKRYTPVDIAFRYLDTESYSVFVDEFRYENTRYAVLLGFKTSKFKLHSIWLDVEHVNRMMIAFPLVGLSICIVFSILIGFYSSSKIALPIQAILNRIELLSNSIYHKEYTKDPFYSEIYSDLNKLSEDLQQAELEREELERLKLEWISNISHDIKTPLASIRGYSEIMKDYELSEEDIKKYGDILNEKSIYIEELLGELRLSNRLKDKKIELKTEDTNLVEFSKNIIVDILNTENYSAEIEFLSNEDEIYKSIDRFMFKRIFENLIYNSIRYSKDDIKIEISLERMGKNLLFRFRDNGIGIKEEDLKNIFNRYYRGSNTKKKGTGLGLAITKDIVERHGGRIEVSSKLGEFTEFKISF